MSSQSSGQQTLKRGKRKATLLEIPFTRTRASLCDETNATGILMRQFENLKELRVTWSIWPRYLDPQFPIGCPKIFAFWITITFSHDLYEVTNVQTGLKFRNNCIELCGGKLRSEIDTKAFQRCIRNMTSSEQDSRWGRRRARPWNVTLRIFGD